MNNLDIIYQNESRDTIRIKGENLRDLVAYTAAALHNLRNYSRNPIFST